MTNRGEHLPTYHGRFAPENPSAVLYAIAAAEPGRLAMKDGERRWDYAALERDVDRCARGLRAVGLESGHRVAMLSAPVPEFLILLLAAFRIGVLWCGLNPRYTPSELGHVLADFAPQLVVASENQAVLRSLTKASLVSVGDTELVPGARHWDELLATGADAAQLGEPSAWPSGHDPAIVVYTSGTSGRPKGAVLPHSAFFHCYAAVLGSFARVESIRDGMSIVCNLPINHIGCVAEVCMNTLFDAGSIHFMSRFDPALMLAEIEAQRITTLGGVPAMLQMIAAHPDFAACDLSSLRIVTWGGAPMPEGLIARFARPGMHLFTNYGLTEGGSVNSATRPGADLATLAETVGFPDADHRYRVAGPDGEAVAAGSTGEVQMQGRGLFLGYLNQPEATAAAFTGDGWFRTGDLVEVRLDGAWRLVGRTSEMFKSGGYNVYPREVEAALEAHEDVELAVLVPVADPLFHEVGVAFVMPRRDRRPDPAALLAHARTRLANYKLPKRIELRAELPMLPIGKVDKGALRREAAALQTARGEPQA